MSLNFRFFLASLCLIFASFAATWPSVSSLAEGIIEEWAVRYAEKQVLYDRERTLQPIIRELALAHQFAKSAALIRFARQPYDPSLRKKALQEMENFRFDFLEMNYFVALYKTGEYFHNDANNRFQGRQLRYVLSQKDPADAWFYQQIKQKRNIHVNVNWDDKLDATKLWTNVLLKDGKDVLGIVGTGLNLKGVLERMVQRVDPGVTNIFVDHIGAIQLYHDSNLINFSSFTQPTKDLHRVDDLIDTDADRAILKQSMQNANKNADSVISQYIQVEGKRSLLAVAYLPEIDWYAITLIDLEKLLPISRFSGIFIIYGVTLIIFMVLINIALRMIIMRPLEQLNKAIDQLKQGQAVSDNLKSHGEIGLLIRHFKEMAAKVTASQSHLEQQVKERTQELEIATRTDPLTHLLNRRGMMEILEERMNPPWQGFSLILLDLDFFKEINDQHGHCHGDNVLTTVARILKKHVDISGIGTSARWGGDELLACVSLDQAPQLLALAESIRLEIAQTNPRHDYTAIHDHSTINSTQSLTDTPLTDIPLTVSIGVYVVRRTDDLAEAIHNTDKALYQAKSDGRNLVRLFQVKE